MASLGTVNSLHVLVWPACISASAFSTQCSATAAEYAWKYVRARLRSIALLHCGIFHSNSTAGFVALLGSRILTLCPVDSTRPPRFTSPARAVAHRRAMGPPPVSRARYLSVRLSYQRGDIVQLYLSLKSRFCGLGIVVWFQGWCLSTGLPSGSRSTKVLWFCQSS